MIKNLICIQCPQGCLLEVAIEDGYFTDARGHKCPKGLEYARQEIENPQRTLTSTILCQGLPLKMLPVKTDHPIPKSKLSEAMEEIKKIRLNKPIKIGEAVIENFLGLGVNLISLRDIS